MLLSAEAAACGERPEARASLMVDKIAIPTKQTYIQTELLDTNSLPHSMGGMACSVDNCCNGSCEQLVICISVKILLVAWSYALTLTLTLMLTLTLTLTLAHSVILPNLRLRPRSGTCA
jgi:hypothetical protein